MKINIVTIFPHLIETFLDNAMVKRAKNNGVLEINIFNLREYSKDKHKCVDDYPFGGGPGMVLKSEPFFNFLKKDRGKLIYPSPQGVVLDNDLAKELSNEKEITLICGHYEGIDERVLERVDLEISIGDYVVSGGELPSLIVLDSIIRFIPNFMNNIKSAKQDSFNNNLLDSEEYTRPSSINGETIPDVLLSGHHGKIAEWKKRNSILRTLVRRPDLINDMSESDKKILKDICKNALSKI